LLIDELMPRFDFAEHHATRVHASPERVWAAIHERDFADSWLIRLLMAIRARGRRASGGPSPFTVVAEDPPREVVIGIEGPFWKLNCKPRPVTRESYRQPPPAGTALAAWNFAFADGVLSTETRVLCGDPASRRKFGMYWLVIRPGSGLIRRVMLRRIRRNAERA
jgi:uncharacterized protein YndB with AHSA1/START domain